MPDIEKLINAAKPEADPEDQVLEAMYEAAAEKGNDISDRLLLRLTLAGVRRVDTRSKVLKQRVDFLWYGTLAISVVVALTFYLLYAHTNGFKDVVIPIAGAASLVAAMGNAIAHR